MFTKLVYLSKGVASLTEELAARLPVTYDSPVKSLVIEKGRIVGVEMESDGSVKRAGHVIVATDPASASAMMPEELEEEREFFDSIIYPPFPMPVFFLDRPLRKDVWCYFTDPGLKKEIAAYLKTKAGKRFSSADLQADVEMITREYRSRGFLDAQVVPRIEDP